MLVYKRIPLGFLLRVNWSLLSYVISLSLLTWWGSSLLDVNNPTILLPSLAVYGAILSIFLAFRTNEAYSRWWEARTLWGQLVNSSRTLVRELLTYVSPDKLSGEVRPEVLIRSMAHRHVAYVNALRLHLRTQSDYDSELKGYVQKEELDKILNFSNKPSGLLVQQTLELKTSFNREGSNTFGFVKINDTLNRFYDIQGGCERIKNTVFPRLYTYYTNLFTWLFSTLLIVSLLDEFEWQTALIRGFVAYVFLTLNHLSTQLKNPFENRFSDTPMTALCRTIEIDLREMIGEKHDIQPPKPVKGILN